MILKINNKFYHINDLKENYLGLDNLYFLSFILYNKECLIENFISDLNTNYILEFFDNNQNLIFKTDKYKYFENIEKNFENDFISVTLTNTLERKNMR